MYGSPKQYCVYIMASKKNGVLYIGVTGGLPKRIREHKNDVIECFTQKYFVHRLVYFEQTENVYSALTREKQLKNWLRNTFVFDLLRKVKQRFFG